MSCIQATTTYKPSLGRVVRKHHKSLEPVYCASLSSTFYQKPRSLTSARLAYSAPKYKRLAPIRGIGGAGSAASNDDVSRTLCILLYFNQILHGREGI
jgi:hypothetical protein